MNVETGQTFLVVCAWCKKETGISQAGKVGDVSSYLLILKAQGIAFDTAVAHVASLPVSHGICPECAAREIAALRANRPAPPSDFNRWN